MGTAWRSRLRTTTAGIKSGGRAIATRAEAVEAWRQLGKTLAMSGDAADQTLAKSIAAFVRDMPSTPPAEQARQALERAPKVKLADLGPRRCISNAALYSNAKSKRVSIVGAVCRSAAYMLASRCRLDIQLHGDFGLQCLSGSLMFRPPRPRKAISSAMVGASVRRAFS